MNNTQLILFIRRTLYKQYTKARKTKQNKTFYLFEIEQQHQKKKSTHAHGKENHMAALNSIYVIFPYSVKHSTVIRFPHVMIKCALVCLRWYCLGCCCCNWCLCCSAVSFLPNQLSWIELNFEFDEYLCNNVFIHQAPSAQFHLGKNVSERNQRQK